MLHFTDRLLEYGITNRSLDEAEIKRAMMDSSRHVFACADSSKFGQKVFAKLCGPSEVEFLITEKMGKKDRGLLTSYGVKVLLPEKSELETGDK